MPPALWISIYVGFLQRLRAAWPSAHFLLGCAPWPHQMDGHIRAAIGQFADPANRTTFLDFGDFSAVERGCYSHPSVGGHQVMAEAVLAAIRGLGGGNGTVGA